MADSNGESCPPAKRSKRELRKYERLPVWICENHEEVLYHIYRAVASKYLPFQGITLLHFDSHPDLTVPVQLLADHVFDKEKLLEQISIADWILPAVYAGHVDRVVWVRPPWSDQICEGVFQFKVGKHKNTGYVRVTCVEDYYVEELLCSPEEELENCHDLELIVCTLHPVDGVTEHDDTDGKKEPKHLEKGFKNSANSSCSESPGHCVEKGHPELTLKYLPEKKLSNIYEEVTSPAADFSDQVFSSPTSGMLEQKGKKIREQVLSAVNITAESNRTLRDLHSILACYISDQKPYILDVDMDFFSTQNPFTGMYTEQEFQCICDVYRFDKPVSSSEEDLKSCIKRRKAQLEEIEETLRYVSQTPNPSGQVQKQSAGGRNLNKDLIRLTEGLKRRKGEELDYELLHSAGMSMDLPHHVSSTRMIDSLMESLQITVSALPKPTLVTVARSTHDEYTPPGQVELIQSRLLCLLGRVFGSEHIDVHKDYEGGADE